MRIRVIALLCLLPSFVNAQQENSKWIFPYNVGLDFNSADGKPTVFQPNTGHGIAPATVCDAKGNLLFYTDGDSVWNCNGKVMPNGRDLKSSWYTYAQSTIVLPIINQPDKYFLFTIQGSNDWLHYSVIDMSLDNGLGDIVTGQKKVFIARDVAPCMTAVRGEGCYTWLVAHTRSGQDFLAFRIDANGIDTTPVISPSFTRTAPYSYSLMNMASSPDRKKMAIGSSSKYAFVEVHDFDPANGRVSNPQLLSSYGDYGRVHGICFSPNSNVLYVTGGYSGDDLTQYDLSKLPAIAIQNVNDSAYLNGGMRLGPDGRIYCAQWEGVYTVLYPDSIGKSCHFSRKYITLPQGVISQSRQLGVDMAIPDPRFTRRSVDTIVCSDYPAIVRATTSAVRYVWNDGDTASSKAVYKTSKCWVQSFRDCDVHVDTFNVTVSNCNCIVSVPDAFTPNNDGRNDGFKVLGTDITGITLRIYNRYGQCVFQTSDIMRPWDGKAQGKECETGSYYYFLRARCIKGQEVFKKGALQLLR
jgi:gliding motility-associated-like protein